MSFQIGYVFKRGGRIDLDDISVNRRKQVATVAECALKQKQILIVTAPGLGRNIEMESCLLHCKFD